MESLAFPVPGLWVSILGKLPDFWVSILDKFPEFWELVFLVKMAHPRLLWVEVTPRDLGTLYVGIYKWAQSD